MQQRYRDVLDDFERRYIMQALQTVNGNRLQAAKLLGVERKSLYEKMKRLNIDK
jgi:DNA-binding NtrC family response regulator